MSNRTLLVALLLLLVAEPFVSRSVQTFEGVVFDVIVSTVLIAAVWAVSRGPRLRAAGLSLAAATFAARWALPFADGRWLHILWLLLAIVFFAFTAAVLLRQALGDSVTADTIAGAICVYLLLGVVWALTFNVIEVTHPGSFLIGGRPLGTSAGVRQSSIPELFYLSLITLSTVGYGDVLPATAPARMIAALEGIAGQLYLAVLIARLVGIRASRSGAGA